MITTAYILFLACSPVMFTFRVTPSQVLIDNLYNVFWSQWTLLESRNQYSPTSKWIYLWRIQGIIKQRYSMGSLVFGICHEQQFPCRVCQWLKGPNRSLETPAIVQHLQGHCWPQSVRFAEFLSQTGSWEKALEHIVLLLLLDVTISCWLPLLQEYQVCYKISSSNLNCFE